MALDLWISAGKSNPTAREWLAPLGLGVGSSGNWSFTTAAVGTAPGVAHGTATPGNVAFSGAAVGRKVPLTAYDKAVLDDSPLWTVKGALELEDYTPDTGSLGWPWRFREATVDQSPVQPDGGRAISSSLLSSGLGAWKSFVPNELKGPNVSIAFWMDVPAGNIQGIVASMGNGAVPDGWGVSVGNGALNSPGRRICVHTNGFSFGDTGVTLSNGLNHVVAVRGAGTALTLYVNGSVVFSGNLHASVADAYSYMSILESASTNLKVDNVAYFASALSGARVTAQYNGGAGDNAAVAADNPRVWLRLDDPSYATSTVLPDASGLQRPMTMSGLISPGGPPPLAPMGGKAVGTFSVAANPSTAHAYARIASPSWAQSLGALSAEIWFRGRTTGGSPNTLMAMDDVAQSPSNALRKFILFIDATGKLTWQDYTTAGGTPFVQPATNYLDGNWHHVVVTRDATTLRMYVDGNTTPVGTAAIGGTSQTASTSDLLVGATGYSVPSAGWTFKGEWARPALYGTTLPAARVNAHYLAASMTAGETLGAWAFTGSASGSGGGGGEASGSWSFSGSAAGVAPDGQGSASGSWAYAGAAVGGKTKKGSASGTWRFAGAAVGKKGSKGQGSKKPMRGGSAGTWSFLGQAQGLGGRRGQASGAWRFLGLAAGGGPPKSFGQWNWVGSASGLAPTFFGTGTGEWRFEGAAEGTRPQDGSTFGDVTWRGEAMGEVASEGFAYSDWFFTGVASGDAAEAYGAGQTLWQGSAVGQTPTPKGQSFNAQWTFFGYAEGSAPQSATAAGDWTFAGEAQAFSPKKGEAAGSVEWVGLAEGYTLSIGHAADGTMWVGFAIGPPDPDRTLWAGETGNERTQWADRDAVTLRADRGSRVYR